MKKYSWPDNWPAGAVTPLEQKLLKEISKDSIAFEKLKFKAKREQCSLFSTLRQWGDPRNWP